MGFDLYTKMKHLRILPTGIKYKDHQRLAEAECRELLQQDLIKPSDSQWACEAFYVNKRFEQARGKLSPNEETHTALLKEFQQLVLRYGIMLSERKMKIAQKEIEFLGMNLKGEQYQPGPHIAQELLKFPEEDLSKKQVLQFLGIVNYLRDFIPKISKYTNPLRKMLKKDPPPWSKTQTMAVRVLKEKLQQLPPLQIPSDGKRILQTDASDKYWGAILFEERDGKRHICGYKSGRFSEAEIHYHSTFKEILAVKKGISKFEFHLICHHFHRC
ncbi:hypothetical protein V6N12_058097 [Hibiscus sabdariffa]|uniref:Reverse transcriptase/retrotransposon-derived protein RNase H-like domain-containing protein n=1 Tax=Hibiscus sabdariffa TaxID=183260 RepID=A0ABR2BP84_9ROSI